MMDGSAGPLSIRRPSRLAALLLVQPSPTRYASFSSTDRKPPPSGRAKLFRSLAVFPCFRPSQPPISGHQERLWLPSIPSPKRAVRGIELWEGIHRLSCCRACLRRPSVERKGDEHDDPERRHEYRPRHDTEPSSVPP